MEQVEKHWRDLLARLDRMSRRERVQLVVMLLVIGGAAWSQLALDPFNRELKEIRRQRAQVENAMREMASLESEILARKDKDPDQAAKERIAAITEEIATLDGRLSDQGSLGTVSPAEMIQALRKLLATDSGLTLVTLDSLPPKSLMEQDDAEGKVYRHTLVMRFSGTFPDALKYLRAMERLPWKFFWESVQIAVVEYPRAYVTLRINTLSLTADLLGAESR
ncbi:MAG: hypothetical protein HQM03_14240 [Magnetococcales bacterium]|nr:hypothetical protein [Magnetococcales bacterium]